MAEQNSKQIAKELSILTVIGVLAIIILNYSTDIFKRSKDLNPKECSPIYIYNCDSQISCESNNLFWWDEGCHLAEKAKPKPSEYPDYDYFQSLNKKIELVTSTPSWVKEPNNPKAIEGRKYKGFIKSNGNIRDAYLFVDVSVDNGKPLKVWDSIYISIRKVAGNYLYLPQDGHLLRSKSLKVPPSDTTRLLFDLRQIPFTDIPYSDENKYTNKDWLTLIQGADKFQLETFLSTLRKGGMINNISIGYECSEDTPNCKLELINF